MRMISTSVALVLVTAGLAMAPGISAAAAPDQTELHCDAVGEGSWNDCIRHRHVHGTRDHMLHGDEPLTTRTRVHPALHGADLIGETQVRPVDMAGMPSGPWRTIDTYRWNADPGTAKHAKTTHACTPPEPGLYQVRMCVVVPKTHAHVVRGVTLRAAEVVASSAPSTVASNGPNCYNSNTDESIIEYFNLINFMDDFMVKVSTKDDTAYEVSILCPQRQSVDMPPQEFELSLTSVVGGLRTSCYSSTPLTISKDSPDCQADGLCAFLITASNSATDKIYSTTEVQIALKDDLMVAPNLMPATLPICLSTVAPCLSEDECNVDSTSGKVLTLNPGDTFTTDDTVTFTASSPSPSPSSVSATPTPTPSPSASTEPSPSASASPTAEPSPTPSTSTAPETAPSSSAS